MPTNKRKLERISFTLPPALLSDLAAISERIGVSRSAIVADLLTGPAHDMRELLEAIPPAPTQADLLRLRGKSEALIEERLAMLHGVWKEGGV